MDVFSEWQFSRIIHQYICPWVHAGVSCEKKYANALTADALKHLHKLFVNLEKVKAQEVFHRGLP